MKALQALIVCLCVLTLCLTAVHVADRLTRRPSSRPAPGARKPEAGSRRPEAGGRKPEAVGGKPETGGDADTAVGRRPLASDLPWAVGVASTMTKVFRDEPFAGPAATRVELALARREIEGVQLVVAARTQELRDVAVAVSPLRSACAVFPAADIAWNLVGYVETKGERPYWTDKVGFWPDPLLAPRKFSVAKGAVQPIWLNVHAAPGTPPGLYKGPVTVAPANAAPWRVELSVRVWGFTLPRTGHLKTLCWMDPRPMLRFYGLSGMDDPAALDVVKDYAALALRNRLAPGGTLGCGFSWAKPQWPVRKTQHGYDFARAEELLRFGFERGMNCFLMAIIPNLKRTGWPGYSDAWKAAFRDFVAAYARFLREKGWEQFAYVYNFDEAPRAYWDVVKQNYQMVKAIDPRLRVIQCLNEPAGVKALAGFADTWDVYVAQHHKAGVAERMAAGDEVWWAVCLYPKERPNLFVDYPAIDARILGWLAWMHGISGFEYWSIVAWGNANVAGQGGKKWPDVPWQLARFAGDGFLCYPGPARKPLSSVRFENLRDGFEDYEYLWLLRAKLPRLSGSDRAAAERLLRIGPPLAENNRVYTDDPAVVLERRAAIARLLEGKKGRQPPAAP